MWLLLLLQVLVRLLVPEYRQPITGTAVFAVVLIGLGLGVWGVGRGVARLASAIFGPSGSLSAEEMAGLAFVPGEAMARLFGPAGRTAMLAVAMLVCLGALSSTVLATIRVTFALARDGLTFRFMARMSRSQAPVPALIVVGAVSVVLVWNREFEQVLGIYFFAAAVLFGLSYASLIVFRLREGAIPAHVFRCPAGPIQAGILILCQSALAVYIAWSSPHDAAYSTLMLVGLGVLYVLWKRGFNSGRG